METHCDGPEMNPALENKAKMSLDFYRTVLLRGQSDSVGADGKKKSQGHKARAPEGMSILAFLGISPFQRLLMPLTKA